MSDTGDAPWRPQPRQRQGGLIKQRVVAVAIALFVGGWVLFAFSRFASSSPDKVQLGSRVFDLGSARTRASTISQTGPLFFNDLIQGGRSLPVVVLYVGLNPGAKGAVDPKNFIALNAIPPVATPACPVDWIKAKDRLVQSCTKLEYLPDGTLSTSQTVPLDEALKGATDMERFEVFLGKKGRLVVDLNRRFGAAPPVTVTPTIVLN
jgi:hypothetical protein